MNDPRDRGWRTDKVSLGYLPEYYAIKAHLAEEIDPNDTGSWRATISKSHRQKVVDAIHILEVGVAGGGGLAMFRDVFETTNVWGVDLDPKAGTLDDQSGGYVLTASQDDPGLPLVVESRWGRFHLIVDDASHLAGPTSITLTNLWPLVLPGGFYVIEDWNYLEAGGMAQNLWQKIFGHMLAFPSVDLRDKPPPPYSGMLSDIADVKIRDGMIILRKRS